MLLVDGEKYACIRCIRGHRSSTCKHRQRPLVQVRRRGRPVAECNHRLAVLPDGTCECGVAAIILPKVRSGSTFAPVIEEGEGGKRKIQDTSEDAHQRVVLIRQGSGSCCGGAQTTSSATEQSTRQREYESERSALVGTTATKQRVIYDPSSVEIQEIEAQTTPRGGVKLKRSGSSSSSLSSDRSTADTTTVKSEDGNEVWSCCGEKAEASCCGGQQADGQRRPIKLRSVVLKPDVDSAAIVRTLDMAQQSLPTVQSVEYYPPQVGLGSQATAAASTQYGRETMKAGGEYENEELYANASPTVAYDEALYSLEAYLQASSQEQAQPYASHNLLMQEAAGVVSQAQQAAAAVSSSSSGSSLQTLSQQEIESLTRYSSRTGVVSYPTGRIGGFTGGEGVQMGTYNEVYVPEGVQLSTSQKELSDHMTLLQQQQQVDEDGLDNLFSVYLTSACAVPGGTCMCSDECNCPGCMKHGNVFVGENEGGREEEGFGLEWGR